jgi:hypothetical protein
LSLTPRLAVPFLTSRKELKKRGGSAPQPCGRAPNQALSTIAHLFKPRGRQTKKIRRSSRARELLAEIKTRPHSFCLPDSRNFQFLKSASPGYKLSAKAPASVRAYKVNIRLRFYTDSLSENCEITEIVTSNANQKAISTKEPQKRQLEKLYFIATHRGGYESPGHEWEEHGGNRKQNGGAFCFRRKGTDV